MLNNVTILKWIWCSFNRKNDTLNLNDSHARNITRLALSSAHQIGYKSQMQSYLSLHEWYNAFTQNNQHSDINWCIYKLEAYVIHLLRFSADDSRRRIRFQLITLISYYYKMGRPTPSATSRRLSYLYDGKMLRRRGVSIGINDIYYNCTQC